MVGGMTAFKPAVMGFKNCEFKTLSQIKLNQINLERFSIECRKTKTKVIRTANQSKYSNEPMRTESKHM